MFCDSDILAKELPWFEFVCGRGPSTLVSVVFAAYLLCVIVFLMIGGFFYWNFVLISFGDTYLGIIVSLENLYFNLIVFFFIKFLKLTTIQTKPFFEPHYAIFLKF